MLLMQSNTTLPKVGTSPASLGLTSLVFPLADRAHARARRMAGWIVTFLPAPSVSYLPGWPDRGTQDKQTSRWQKSPECYYSGGKFSSGCCSAIIALEAVLSSLLAYSPAAWPRPGRQHQQSMFFFCFFVRTNVVLPQGQIKRLRLLITFDSGLSMNDQNKAQVVIRFPYRSNKGGKRVTSTSSREKKKEREKEQQEKKNRERRGG